MKMWMVQKMHYIFLYQDGGLNNKFQTQLAEFGPFVMPQNPKPHNMDFSRILMGILDN